MEKIEIVEPEEHPATTDPYLLIYWEQGLHRLLELLRAKDRRIESLLRFYDEVVLQRDHWSNAYWDLRRRGFEENKEQGAAQFEIERLKTKLALYGLTGEQEEAKK